MPRITIRPSTSPPPPPSPPPSPPPPSPPPSPTAPVQVLPKEVGQAIAKAQANTPQWQAFKARLDGFLDWSVGYPCYQGAMLTMISDYALGYLCTGNKLYADKALGLMQSAALDYQSGVQAYGGPPANPNSQGGDCEINIQFIGLGDGTKTAFTLPHTPNPAASLAVYFGRIDPLTLIKGSVPENTSSPYYMVIQVGNSPGASDYTSGVDYQQGVDVEANYIEWLPGGRAPASGATYYVGAIPVLAYIQQKSGWSLSGNTLSFTTPPSNSTAVLAAYLYTADDGITRQQTGNGYGGYNNVFIDTPLGNSAGYACRHLGQHVACGLDWLWAYPGFSSTRKQQLLSLLPRWIKAPFGGPGRDGQGGTSFFGYQIFGAAGSNYGAGEWAMAAWLTAALNGKDSNVTTYAQMVADHYAAYIQPCLSKSLFVSGKESQPSYGTILGGWWPEGFNYAKLAVQSLLLSSQALNETGLYQGFEDLWKYASDYIRFILSSSSDPLSMYDWGAWFAAPAPFPERFTLPAPVALADDPKARAYGNWVLQNYTTPVNADAVDLLLRDPAAVSSQWLDVPPTYLASGGGVLCSRDGWTAPSTLFLVMMGNLKADSGHQLMSVGMVEANRGPDKLLINGLMGKEGSDQNASDQTLGVNTIVIDDNGDGAQNYRWQQGVWPGNPGCQTIAYEAADTYAVMQADLHAVYSLNINPGAGGSCSEWVRSFVHIRPNYCVVHDRVTTTSPNYPKQLQWIGPANGSSVANNLLSVHVGSSRAWVQVYTPSGQATTPGSDNLNYGDPALKARWFVNTQARCRYTSVIDVEPDSVAAMDVHGSITSDNGELEGAYVGLAVVLFVQQPPFHGPASYDYPQTGMRHVIVGLPPATAYEMVDATGTVHPMTTTNNGVLAFIF